MGPTDGCVTVAAGQIVAAPLSGAVDALSAAQRLIAQAAERQAELVVLPECTYPAYCIDSIEAYRHATKLSPDAYVGELGRLARRFRLHVVSGFVEDSGTSLTNAAVLIDDAGRELGRHRKTFLWDRDNEWFAPGDRIEAFDSRIGRIGLIICAEARCPEVAATLAAGGAELLAMPTCWFNTASQAGEYTNPQAEYLIQARAREFGIPFVCADKSGNDGAAPGYCGLSLIVDGDGTRLAEAPGTGEALIVSRVALRTAPMQWVHQEERGRILSPKAPVRPPADAGPVTVALVPRCIVREHRNEHDQFLKALKAQGVQVLATSLSDEAAAALSSAARVFDIHTVSQPSWTGVRELGRDAGLSRFRAACLPGEAIRSFAPTRVAAMEGAAVVFVADTPRDPAFLRTRALENRLYVIATAEDWAAVIAPDGSVTAMTGPQGPVPIIATIDLALAADKRMAPRTDIFEQRRLAAFDF
jgi:predicted amidohydrolase